MKPVGASCLLDKASSILDSIFISSGSWRGESDVEGSRNTDLKVGAPLLKISKETNNFIIERATRRNPMEFIWSKETKNTFANRATHSKSLDLTMTSKETKKIFANGAACSSSKSEQKVEDLEVSPSISC